MDIPKRNVRYSRDQLDANRNGYSKYTREEEEDANKAENYDFTPDDEKVALLWAVLASYLPSGTFKLIHIIPRFLTEADHFPRYQMRSQSKSFSSNTLNIQWPKPDLTSKITSTARFKLLLIRK
jgi:hypothetical protein